MSPVTPLNDQRAVLGECPVWSTEEARLYWVDIEGKRVHRHDPATGNDESQPLPVRPGSIALTVNPGVLLVAAENEIGWLDFTSGTYRTWHDLEKPGTGNRLNDGRTDPAGRFWVGSMFERPSENRFTGHLHRIEADGTHATLRSEIGVTNGLAFSPSGTTMYFADTLQDTVWAYEYDPDSGAQSNQRVFADFRDLPGRPDGACVDEDGCYWVACVDGWSLLRLTPAGRVDREVPVPVQRPTMPAFGGPGLDTLFFTSIRGNEEPPPGDDPELAGAVFVYDPGVKGLPEPVFAGLPVS